METKKLIIIGSGPAGYTAAIYAARANLAPVLYEGALGSQISDLPGGQLMTTTEVENFPGFPHGIDGSALMDACKAQAVRFGTEVISKDVVHIDFSSRPFLLTLSEGQVKAETIIIATGATAQRVDIEGTMDGQLWQKGVTACAVCDGALPLFRNKELFVIGGGDSAVEEAIFLTKFGSKVYIVHRRGFLRASKIMAQRAMEHEKITILWDSEIILVEGDGKVESVTVQNVITRKAKKMKAAGVFFAIGHKPNTSFLGGYLKTDETGYLLVEPGTTKTSVPGVFAAGDVQDKVYRQAITAAGSGCMAALEAERFLAEHPILV